MTGLLELTGRTAARCAMYDLVQGPKTYRHSPWRYPLVLAAVLLQDRYGDLTKSQLSLAILSMTNTTEHSVSRSNMLS